MLRPSARALAVALLLAPTLAGCYRFRASRGGGEARFEGERRVDAADVLVPEGYRVEAVATGLTFPTGVAFDDEGRPHVTESGYAYGEVFLTPRLVRVEDDGRLAVVAEGTNNGPWNGVAFHPGSGPGQAGAFYVAEGGQLEGGRILRIAPDGRQSVLVDGLPSLGDHHTNGPVVGPDGWLYFGQGTATNAGVVGPDNAEFGWLRRFPRFHDTPCETVTLAGQAFRSENPLTGGDRDDDATTGAFAAFGTTAGPTVEGGLPCSGAVHRVRLDGSGLEWVAWGFRNPYGLAFAPDGRLFVTDNGYDARGSRPAWGTADYLWHVEPGTWYGWPDFAGGVPFGEGRFDPPGDPAPEPLLAEHPGRPPRPAALFGVHSSSNGLDFAPPGAFGFEGDAFVAQFGDQAPDVGKVLHPVGYQVVRVEVERGVVHGFAANRGREVGPASKLGGGGFERPIAVRFSPDGQALYVVDFGVFLMSDAGPRPQPGTGVLWRITRDAP